MRATASAASSSVRTSGGARRTTVSRCSVQLRIRPRSQARRAKRAQAPARRTRGRAACRRRGPPRGRRGPTSAPSLAAQIRAERRGALGEAVAEEHLERREAGGARQRMAAERRDVRQRRIVARASPSAPARPTNAPSGRPPPSAFASTRRSGTTPQCSSANSRPVRPKPVTTSSKTRSAPTLVAAPAQRRQEPGRGMRTPPSACTGSTITAAVRSSMARERVDVVEGQERRRRGAAARTGGGRPGCRRPTARRRCRRGSRPSNATKRGRPVRLARGLERALDRLGAARGEVDDRRQRRRQERRRAAPPGAPAAPARTRRRP